MKRKISYNMVGLFIILFSIFAIVSCEVNDNNLQPNEFINAPSKPSMDWAYDGQLLPACKTVCLVAGQYMNVGTVDAAVDNDGNLLVTYNVSAAGIYLEEVHLDIFASVEQLMDAKKVSNGGAIPGKFAYHTSWDASEMVTTHTVKVPAEYIEEIAGDADCFFIAAHAALSNGETAWGGLCEETEKGVSLDGAKQFPGRNWSVYFEFCKEECVTDIDFTYAWEDLRNNNNDGDYNDLVVKSDVIKTATELKISLLAVARGAAFDHAFKFKIPKQGVVGIFGDQGTTSDADFYYVTIFSSTKAALPEFVNGWSANTFNADNSCTPQGTAEIVITINDDFNFNPAVPYVPYITVWPSGTAGDGGSYDLTIWELSGIDTWTTPNPDIPAGEYPNGILIPDDWKWPYERQFIQGPYGNFTSITDGWNPNWADVLTDATKVWSCN